MKILTLEEVKKRGLKYRLLNKGDTIYSYENEGIEYLIVNNQLITSGLFRIEIYPDNWFLCWDINNHLSYLFNEKGEKMLVAESIMRNIKKRGTKEEFFIEDEVNYNFSKQEIIDFTKERGKIKAIKPLALEEIQKLGYNYYEFDNKDYKYQINGIEYLIRKGETIAIGKDIKSYPNGWYQYKKDGFDYLLNKNHFIIAESEEIIVSGENIIDREDLEKYRC